MGEDQLTDNKYRTTLLVIDKVAEIIINVIKYGLPCWALVRIVEALAGQETIVEVAINYFTKSGNSFPWVVSITSIVWAVGERKFRQRKIASMSKHIHELEIRIDPDRTGSGLTDEGRTPSNQQLLKGGRK